MFTFHLQTKIRFGAPAAAVLPEELGRLAAKRVLLVSDPGLAELGMVGQLQEAFAAAGITAVPFTEVTSNPTTDEVAAGLALAQAERVDAVVALGGGSPIDVAKGIAMLLTNGGSYADYQWGGKRITTRCAPLIAIPTTAGTGSEVSKVAVVVDPVNTFKKGVLSPLMFPHVAIADPELTRGMPSWLTAATGIDALIHALEAYVGKRANPFTDQLALAAMRTAVLYLPRATADGDDMEARTQMMLAALWGGIAMDHAGLGLVHSLSGPLSGHGHLHHGLSNGIILPYALRFNAPAIAPEKLAVLQGIFGADGELFAPVKQFVAALGLPTSLAEIEMTLDAATRQALAAETLRMVLMKNNPRPATAADCAQLFAEMA